MTTPTLSITQKHLRHLVFHTVFYAIHEIPDLEIDEPSSDYEGLTGLMELQKYLATLEERLLDVQSVDRLAQSSDLPSCDYIDRHRTRLEILQRVRIHAGVAATLVHKYAQSTGVSN